MSAVGIPHDQTTGVLHPLGVPFADIGLLRPCCTRASATEQLDLCFEAENEVLARKFIRRQLESKQLHKQLEQRLELNDRLLEEGRTDLADKKARLDSLQQKAALFEPSAMRSEHRDLSDGIGGSVAAVSDDDVEVAFLREKRERGVS